MTDYRRHAADYETHQMSMDRRHADAIGSFLRRCRGVEQIVEVGCCYGVSTAEVLAAADEIDAPVKLIDPVPQPSLLAMLDEAPAGRASLVIGTSADELARCLTKNSVVILDGDHTLAAAAVEAGICAAVLPRAIILHDVTNRDRDCEGPCWMMHMFQWAGYRVAIDCLPRRGERTYRGLAIMCRFNDDHAVAMEACSNG